MNKLVTTLTLPVLFSIPLLCCASSSPLKKGGDLCALDAELPQDVMYLRATGHYWLDYRYRGIARTDPKPVVLFVRGDKPAFSDRVGVEPIGTSCREQHIVDFVGVPHTASEVLVLGCHRTDDDQSPPAEQVFGIVAKNAVGLQPAVRAWVATVTPGATAPSVRQLPSSARVYCPVFSGIDE